MPVRWPHPACWDDAALLAACVVSRGRSSGPGGQHRNKVETEIVLKHEASGLIGQAGERRRQSENKSVALRRLRLLLATHLRTPVPRPTGLEALSPHGWTSDLWRGRVHAGRLACNPAHHDYPALLAEALDHLADGAWDPRRAAERLGITPTQLVRLVKDHPPALLAMNEARAKRSLRPLR